MEYWRSNVEKLYIVEVNGNIFINGERIRIYSSRGPHIHTLGAI
jgi:hypothetical protein